MEWKERDDGLPGRQGSNTAWIESHQSLARHRKTLKAAALLKVDRHKLIGHLHELWWWALDNADIQGLLTECSDSEIAEAAGWPAKDGDRFVQALEEAGFIDRDAETHAVSLHDSYEFAGKLKHRNFRSELRRIWEAMAYRTRPLIFARDGHRCVLCGSTKRIEVDHIYPIARGGSNAQSNLRTLCRSCNRRKGARV